MTQMHKRRVAHQAGVYLPFPYHEVNSTISTPLDERLLHRRVTLPIIKIAGTYFYIWMERGTLRLQEHNKMSLARAWNLEHLISSQKR